MKHKRMQGYGPSLVAIVAACVVLFSGPLIVTQLSNVRAQHRIELAKQQLGDSEFLSQFNNSVQAIAEIMKPSVVHITVERQVDQLVYSTGSGWVYDNDGHIITNHHVVSKDPKKESAQNLPVPSEGIVYRVTFFDGSRVKATLVGSDSKTDVAVLRVDGHPVIPALRARGGRVMQGDLVFAFGSPYGFEFSMSSGIVAGQNRQSSDLSFVPNGYENFIQTDAAINPGNSGGPLTNIRGEVVGVNFAITVSSDAPVGALSQFTNRGVGLAIPIGTVEFVADQIIRGGPVERGGLGVDLADLTPLIRRQYKYQGNGVLLREVFENSPAEAAGLLPGDIVVSADGEPVHRRRSFRAIAHSRGPGEQIVLGIWRDGEQFETAVALGRWDEKLLASTLPESSPFRSSVAFEELGIDVIALDEDRLSRLGFDGVEAGLYVQTVRVGSLASDLGLRAGWVLLSVGNNELKDPRDLAQILDAQMVKTDGVDLHVIDLRNERRILRLRVPAIGDLGDRSGG